MTSTAFFEFLVTRRREHEFSQGSLRDRNRLRRIPYVQGSPLSSQEISPEKITTLRERHRAEQVSLRLRNLRVDQHESIAVSEC